MLVQLLTAAFVLVIVTRAEEPYTGHQILVVTPTNQQQLNIVNGLAQLDNVQSGDHQRLNNENNLIVPPTLQRFVKQKLSQYEISYDIVIDDLQSVIDRQRALMFAPQNDFDFDIYNDFESIYAQLDLWSSTCPDGLSCDLSVVGETYEGNEIRMYKLGSSAGSRNAILMFSLIHAREWIAGATVMKVVDKLQNDYGVDDAVTRMLDTYDLYIIPVYNPDGYIHSTTTDRMQRKNRTPNEGSNCRGTDLNRNNDVKWGTEGVSFNPCSDLFCGSAGGSELETIAYNNVVFDIQNTHTVWSVIDFHAYGNMWMHPYGNTVDSAGDVCERADDHDDMFHIAEVTSEAIMNTHDTNWDYGTSCEVIYETTGSTGDWARDLAGVKYPFAVELRGNNFTPDEDQIDPSYQEIWNGLVAMADEITDVHELTGN